MNASYTGTDNLHVMTEAVNYNQSLVQLVTTAIPDKSSRILDFGAGIGLYSEELRACGYRNLTLFEPDVAQAERLVDRGFSVVSRRDELDDSVFDACFMLNVLEHIEDHDEAIAWLRRHLCVSGIAFVYVPAFEWLYTSMDFRVGHHRRYTAESLAARFSSADWAVDEPRYADSLGIFATLAYRLLGVSDGSVNRAQVLAYDRFVFPLSRKIDLLSSRWGGKNVYVRATAV